jgi:hypothetical protein
LVVCLQRRGKEKAQTGQRKQPTIHGGRLGRGSGEDELPADEKRPQFAGNLFVLSSLSACNARMALDLASPSSGDLSGLGPYLTPSSVSPWATRYNGRSLALKISK